MVVCNLSVMESTLASVLAEYPSSSVNNSRAIIKDALLAFKKAPSEHLAQKLEAYGITVDWSDGDNDGQYQKGEHVG